MMDNGPNKIRGGAAAQAAAQAAADRNTTAKSPRGWIPRTTLAEKRDLAKMGAMVDDRIVINTLRLSVNALLLKA